MRMVTSPSCIESTSRNRLMWVPLKWWGRWTDIEIIATVGNGFPSVEDLDRVAEVRDAHLVDGNPPGVGVAWMSGSFGGEWDMGSEGIFRPG